METCVQKDDSTNIVAEEIADKWIQTFLNYMESP